MGVTHYLSEPTKQKKNQKKGACFYGSIDKEKAPAGPLKVGYTYLETGSKIPRGPGRFMIVTKARSDSTKKHELEHVKSYHACWRKVLNAYVAKVNSLESTGKAKWFDAIDEVTTMHFNTRDAAIRAFKTCTEKAGVPIDKESNLRVTTDKKTGQEYLDVDPKPKKKMGDWRKVVDAFKPNL